jgi:hypothetical protein
MPISLLVYDGITFPPFLLALKAADMVKYDFNFS